MNPLLKTVAIAALGVVALAGTAQARDQIRIVGSSTVFPFSTAVAENFGKTSSFKTPVVESTGSGGGLKLFCAGVGVEHPDITNASRRIKKSEVELCGKNGVTDIVEVKVGYDGIVIGNAKSATDMKITKEQIFLALAKEIPDASGNMIPNPNKKWSDIDPSLPNAMIEVLGPPPTSGTRDAFVELAMEGGAKKIEALAALRKKDKKAFGAIAHSIREDGAFIEAGENDNLIVQKLIGDEGMYGVFGYSFMEENSDRLQAATLNGKIPTAEAIAADDYPVARSLFFYVKKAHVGVVPGIQEYVSEFTSNAAMGQNGYLKDVGLIVPPRAALMDLMDKAENMPNLTLDELK